MRFVALGLSCASLWLVACDTPCNPGNVETADGWCVVPLTCPEGSQPSLHHERCESMDAGTDAAAPAEGRKEDGVFDPTLGNRMTGRTGQAGARSAGAGAKDPSSDSAAGRGGASAGRGGTSSAMSAGKGAQAAEPARCGNVEIEGDERCDGKCPTDPSECPQPKECFVARVVGSAADCSADCEVAPLEECASGDGCCPKGCKYPADQDCSKSCGDGVVDAPEKCEPSSKDKPCPTACDDGNPCTKDVLTGTSEQCSAECSNTPIQRNGPVSCDDSDPCTQDMRVESTIACTYECVNAPTQRTGPASCDDGDPCTRDDRTESSTSCVYECVNTPMQRTGPTSCNDGDPCTRDDRVESSNACMYECSNTPVERTGPSSCDDGDRCTDDAVVESTSACTRTCSHKDNGVCSNPCGNGERDSGEYCDPVLDGAFFCTPDCQQGHLYTPCDLMHDVDCGDPTHTKMGCWDGGICMPKVATEFDVASCPKVPGYKIGILWGNACAIECSTPADCPPHLTRCVKNDERAHDPAREVKARCLP